MIFCAKNYGSHLVKLDSHSQLAAVLDRDVASVNSLHHQAVDRVGAGLRAVARSEDGFVEALKFPITASALPYSGTLSTCRKTKPSKT